MKMKVESNVRLDERAENAQEEFDKKVVTVGQVHSQALKANEAAEQMRAENRELRNQISKEIAEALKRKRDEEEFEHRRKQELIRQIRELEKIPIVRTKGLYQVVAQNRDSCLQAQVSDSKNHVSWFPSHVSAPRIVMRLPSACHQRTIKLQAVIPKELLI